MLRHENRCWSVLLWHCLWQLFVSGRFKLWRKRAVIIDSVSLNIGIDMMPWHRGGSGLTGKRACEHVTRTGLPCILIIHGMLRNTVTRMIRIVAVGIRVHLCMVHVDGGTVVTGIVVTTISIGVAGIGIVCRILRRIMCGIVMLLLLLLLLLIVPMTAVILPVFVML